MLRTLTSFSLFLALLVLPFQGISQEVCEGRIEITKVYDGDSGDCEILTRYGIKIKDKYRLFGINAPEVRGPGKEVGQASRNFLKELILGRIVTVQYELKSNGDVLRGKYGRIIITMYLNDTTNINELMVSEGFAVEREY